MLKLTAFLLRSLVAPINIDVQIQERIVRCESQYVDVVSDPLVSYCGRMIPGRFLGWLKNKSPFSLLLSVDSSQVSVRIVKAKHGRGFRFGLKSEWKKFTHYSGYYRTHEEAENDLHRLMTIVGITSEAQVVVHNKLHSCDD